MLKGEKVEEKKAILYTDEEFKAEVEKPGVHAFDIYSSWAGPCEAITSVFKKFKNEEKFSYCRVQCDQIEELTRYRNKSCPFFQIYAGGILVKEVRGANAPLLEKNIKEVIQVENEGGKHKPLYSDEVKNTGVQGYGKSRVISNRQGSTYKKVLLSETGEKTFALLKPDIVTNGQVDEIKKIIQKNGFQIVRQQEIRFTPEMVNEFYKEHITKSYFEDFVKFMCSGPSLGLVLSRDNAINSWRVLIGSTNPKAAKEENPKSLRAIYGADSVRNAVHGSKNDEAARKEIKFFFPNETPVIQRTLALIKPDSIQHALEIVQKIEHAGFKIVSHDIIQFTPESAAGFCASESTKVLYDNTVNALCSSPCIAIILERENAVQEWKDLMGPANPQIAKETAPQTLRALYGVNEIQNGFHGSKSLEYAAIEIEYIFPNMFASAEAEAAMTNRTFAIIKPDVFQRAKEVLETIKDNGFKIVRHRELQLTKEQACMFYKEHEGKQFYDNLTNWMSSGPICALLLEKENCVQEWRKTIGPTNSLKAREESPNSIRALYGTNGTQNAVHGSDSIESYKRESAFFFGASAVVPDPESAGTLRNSIISMTQSTMNLNNFSAAKAHGLGHGLVNTGDETEPKAEVDHEIKKEEKKEEMKAEEIKQEVKMEMKEEEAKPIEIKQEEVKVEVKEEEMKPKETLPEEVKPMEMKQEEISMEMKQDQSPPEQTQSAEPTKTEEVKSEQAASEQVATNEPSGDSEKAAQP